MRIFYLLILSLILIYPLNLYSDNNIANKDSIKSKEQIKLIDRNIELIIQNQQVANDSFLVLAKQTLSLAKKQKYQKGINLSYFYIARIYNYRNNTDSASHYYIDGLEYDIINKDLYAHFLGDLAEILRLTGNYSTSLEKSLTLKALIESKQTNQNNYQVYNLLALNYMELMQYDLAFTNFTKSAELALLNNNEAYAGIIYSNIGNLYYKQYKLNEALEYFEKGTKLEKKYELHSNLGNSYNIIADIYLKLNKQDSTQFYLEEAKAINIKSNNTRGLAKTYFEYSKVYLKHYNVDSAEFYLKKTISLASKLNANTLLKDAYLSLSDICAKKNDFENAYYYHNLFFSMHGKIFNVVKINKAKTIEQSLIQEQKERELIEFQLNKQKTINKLFFIIIILAFLAVTIALIYILQFKKLNIKLRISKEKAEESDVLKSEFLKTISHEIRTPLNGIIGFTDMIISDDLPKTELKSIHEYIFKNSQDLTSTIENIVEMAHLSSKQYSVIKTETEVSAIFEKVIAQVNEGFLYNRNKDVTVDLDLKGDFELYSDKNILRKLILQLVKNALKYTEKGKITIGCFKEKSNIILYVKDTGIGIHQEKIDEIFSPFRQIEGNTNIKTGGIGLGLSISKKFAAILEGNMWVESEIKKGSTFFVSLPIK